MNPFQSKIQNLKTSNPRLSCYELLRIPPITSPISIVLLLLWLLFARPVAAHSAGKMQVASAPAGPFLLTVWTSPDPAQVGDLHVSVAVAFAEDNTPALEEKVAIRLAPVDNPAAAQEKTATTEASANKFLYETDFAVQSDGLYQVTVEAHNTAGEGGSIAFDLLVEEKNPFNWSFIVLAGVALLSVGSIVWYIRSSALPKQPRGQGGK